jgi:hypothetical protein
MAALSGQCYGACGRTRGYEAPNPDCKQPHCACLCHESNSGRRS